MFDAVQLKLLLRAIGWISLLFTIPWAVGALVAIGLYVAEALRFSRTLAFPPPEFITESWSYWRRYDHHLIVSEFYGILLAFFPLAASIYMTRGASWVVRSLAGNGVDYAS